MNKTAIGWTEASSNPLYAINKENGKRGWFCTHASPGCTHCYAETLNVGRFGNGLAYIAQNRSKVEWKINEKELESWSRRKKSTKIFVCDMTDLFHEDVPPIYQTMIFDAMEAAPQHTFQVLTKQAARMRDFVNRRHMARVEYALKFVFHADEDRRNCPAAYHAIERAQASPPKNIWLGVSAEDNRRLEERWPALRDTFAAVRFFSFEPLLGWLELQSLFWEDISGLAWTWPDWVIVGGESGTERTEMDLVALREIADQCASAGVALFVKQDSHRWPGMQGRIPDDLWALKQFPSFWPDGSVRGVPMAAR